MKSFLRIFFSLSGVVLTFASAFSQSVDKNDLSAQDLYGNVLPRCTDEFDTRLKSIANEPIGFKCITKGHRFKVTLNERIPPSSNAFFYVDIPGEVMVKVPPPRPRFGESWIDPQGVIWSSPQGFMDNEGKLVVLDPRSGAREITNSKAVNHCKSLGAYLPSLHDYIGRTTEHDAIRPLSVLEGKHDREFTEIQSYWTRTGLLVGENKCNPKRLSRDECVNLGTAFSYPGPSRIYTWPNDKLLGVRCVVYSNQFRPAPRKWTSIALSKVLKEKIGTEVYIPLLGQKRIFTKDSLSPGFIKLYDVRLD